MFFHNKCAKLLNKLQVIQNRCIRNISKLPKCTNNSEEERKFNLLPLHEFRSLHIIQFAFDLVITHPHFLASANSNRFHPRSCDPARTTKTLIENSLIYTLRRAWNNLPKIAHKYNDKHLFDKLLACQFPSS